MFGRSPGMVNVARTLQNLMSGYTPDEVARRYNEYLAPALNRAFKETTLPGVKEAYAGPGTYWGSERAKAEGRAYDVAGEQRGQLLYSMLAQGEQNALAAAQAAAPIEYQQFQSEMADFLRTTPEASPYLEQLLRFLGIQTTENVITQGTSGILGDLIGAAGSIYGGSLAGKK
jgi:hypothetical protein